MFYSFKPVNKIAPIALKTVEVDPNYIILNLLRRREQSIDLARRKQSVDLATSSLLNKSSIALANFSKMPKRNFCVVPSAVKKAYRERKTRAKLDLDEAEAKLWLESLETLRTRCNEEIKKDAAQKETSTETQQSEEKEIKREVCAEPAPEFQAVFCPVGVDCNPILINENVTQIGTAANCKVRLETSCDCVSPLHAVLYNDSQRWEVLNYSPFGLRVDGFQYGLETLTESDDFEDFERGYRGFIQPIATNRVRESFADRVHQLKGSMVFREDKFAKLNKKPSPSESDEEFELFDAPAATPTRSQNCDSVENKGKPKCGCSDPVSGWEAAAPLHHGSVITLGCFQFIFAIRWRNMSAIVRFYPFLPTPDNLMRHFITDFN